ncbi:site-2 protease family protein [Acidithiobacillus sp. M4-SHS-6]|uniref:site-2 protease family protein n=1 Tax=Acidithiobacillus sp. M4-SHS-6 TaxID=3383024 RepID=UPI0039BE22A2
MHHVETWADIAHKFMLHPLGWILILALFLSPLFIHEFGHWVALQIYRIPIRECGVGFGPRIFRIKGFTFRPLLLGAYVLPESKPFLEASATQKMMMALAGPLANFIFSGLLIVVVAARQDAVGNHSLLALSGLSGALGVLNLIPIPPFDGWMILESFLEIVGYPLSAQASEMARRFGSGLLYGLAALLVLWMVDPSPLLNTLF